MPKIGCGSDGLQWSKVQNIIDQVFQDRDINVTVYSLKQFDYTYLEYIYLALYVS